MLSLQLAIKYSRAMFLLAQEEGKLVEYGQELQSLFSDIEGTPGCRRFSAGSFPRS